MNKIKLCIVTALLLLTDFAVVAQDAKIVQDSITVKVDSLYREDQFYIGYTLNSLQNKPENLSQDALSMGFSLGFLRDMPINKRRNVAFATGLGFSHATFNQNLAISKTNGSINYDIITADYDKNKFSMFSVDLPIEFRYRTSTPDNYKFWRWHLGFKLSYLITTRSIYNDGNEKFIVKNNSDFNDLQYGAYFSGGYNTWNVYFYYGLNSIFKSAQINGEPVNMNAANLGLIFYIL